MCGRCPSLVGKNVRSDTSTKWTDDEALMDEDVRLEMNRVLSGGADDAAVRVVNIGKTFKGGINCKPPFTAVFRVNVGIEKETLFCLLGHNGAGKTTTFNMLSGMFMPTYGDAFIFGYSVTRHKQPRPKLLGPFGGAQRRTHTDPCGSAKHAH